MFKDFTCHSVKGVSGGEVRGTALKEWSPISFHQDKSCRPTSGRMSWKNDLPIISSMTKSCGPTSGKMSRWQMRVVNDNWRLAHQPPESRREFATIPSSSCNFLPMSADSAWGVSLSTRGLSKSMLQLGERRSMPLHTWWYYVHYMSILLIVVFRHNAQCPVYFHL